AGPPPVGTSRAYAAYALGLLTLINLLNYTDRNVVCALFEPIKRELVLSDQQLGWLGSAYVIVLSLAALPLGVVGDLTSRPGGVAAERYGWRAGFVALGVPGLLLALLASRLREPRRRPPPTIRATVKSWYARGRVGAHEALRLGAPPIWLTLAGAVLSGVLDLFDGLPRGLDTAVFSAS